MGQTTWITYADLSFDFKQRPKLFHYNRYILLSVHISLVIQIILVEIVAKMFHINVNIENGNIDGSMKDTKAINQYILVNYVDVDISTVYVCCHCV